LHLPLSRVALLNQLKIFKNNVVFHLDSTYKINKYVYPLIAFGFTDLFHTFHPLAYMFTTHEEKVDFYHFFESFIDLTVCFDLPFHVKYNYVKYAIFTSNTTLGNIGI
ncbi:MAG: hypothetical protein HYZ51_02825, partial [Candidatus Doudnabacteria bacterium]|nr:hypothetical protein [Candidatus Doudnabacteria bacterium]